MPFEGPRCEHVASVISIALEHQWIVCSPRPGLASRFEGKSKIKFWASSSLVFSKGWFGFGRKGPYDPGESQTHILVILLPPLSNSLLLSLPGNGFGKTDFFPAFDTISAVSSCWLLSYTHTHTNTQWPWMNIYTSWQILVRVWLTVDILTVSLVTDRKREFHGSSNATNIIQEGGIYHTKKNNSPRWMHAGWSNFSAAAKQ